MNLNEFYCLSGSFLRGELRVRPRQRIADEYRLIRAEDLPEKPLIFDWHMGKKLTDFMPTALAPVELISDRVVAIFKSFEITGWTTYPVVVHNKDGSKIDGYNGLAITGHCGQLDDSRCIQKQFPPPSSVAPSRLSWIGYYFEEKSWDGSDIFIPEGTGIIIVTNRVKEIIRKNKLTNVDFELITEVEREDLPKKFIRTESSPSELIV